MISQRMGKSEIDKRVLEFLFRIGTGVVGWKISQRERPEEVTAFSQELNAAIKRHLGEIVLSSADGIEAAIEFAHRGLDGQKVFLTLDDESAGTRRLVLLLRLIFRTLDAGGVIVIDELDSSLHTQAAEAIAALFSSEEFNPQSAQLLATTHDTNMLRSPYLRRDQIWFTEKDPSGATHLYPLTDFRTREGDNIERGYLQGRYGAIPFSGSISELLSDL